MSLDLTEGSITRRLLLFALPLMVGNLLQQLYNVADTLIVGRFLGADALAAVGSAYTLMVFLTSILLGLCMGSSAFFCYAARKTGYGTSEKQFVFVLPADWCDCGCDECTGFCRTGLDCSGVACAGYRCAAHAAILVLHLFWNIGDVFI